jgi:type VI secretion system protein ImpH
LAIPTGAAEPIRLGRFGQLGWTTWMAPNWTSIERYRRDARFHPAERMKHKRKVRSKGKDREGAVAANISFEAAAGMLQRMN